MKKLILKALSLIATLAVSCGIGYVLGTLAGWLILQLGITEEYYKIHPWRAILWIIAIMVIVIGIPAMLLGTVTSMLFSNIWDKIDDMDDGYIPKKDVEDEEWDS